MVQAEPENPFTFCEKPLECGHTCKGVLGESECLPCLKPECIQKAIDEFDIFMSLPELERTGSNPPRRSIQMPKTEKKPPCVLAGAAENELGGICFTSELGEEPCIKMVCGHVFHANCVLMMLTHKWTTMRITFGYLDCPSCKQAIAIDYTVPILSAKLAEQLSLKAQVLDLATQMAKEEGYDKEGRVVTQGDIYFGKLAEFAQHNCTFYECYRCKEPYFGGMEDCQRNMQSEATLKKENLFCKKCIQLELGFGEKMCKKHGNEFVDWKCMYCCSIALFVCSGGTGYYCSPCHNDASNGGKHNARTQCTGGPSCDLGVPKHPVASRNVKKSAYPLGCSICRSEKIAMLAERQGAKTGANIERRGSMVRRFGGVRGHDINREIRIVKGPGKQGCCTIF